MAHTILRLGILSIAIAWYLHKKFRLAVKQEARLYYTYDDFIRWVRREYWPD